MSDINFRHIFLLAIYTILCLVSLNTSNVNLQVIINAFEVVISTYILLIILPDDRTIYSWIDYALTIGLVILSSISFLTYVLGMGH